jgi:tetratricopeptide (TPR) repeat protein
MINYIIRTRMFLGTAMALTLLAVVCSCVPLFNSLGFEFSAAFAIIGGFIGGIFTLGIWNVRQCETLRDVRAFAGSAAVLLLLLSILPLLIALGNALFVRNCSVIAGLAYYFLLALPSYFFCGALAFLIAIVSARFRKTIFIAFFFLILAHIPFVAFFRPQIFAFNPIAGYFPGVTYDESVNVFRRLMIYRMGTVSATIAIASYAVWLWCRKQKTSDDEPARQPIPEMIVLALLVPFIAVLFLFSDRIGLSSSEDFIREKLGGSYRTVHCDIVYPSGTWKREYAERIGALHEYYYEQLSRYFQVRPAERMTVFFYASPEQKEKLIGASQTDISKPWMHQSHINAADAEAVLKHEMAHLFAAEFGWSPLRISKNSGLIEGAAVAADGVSYEDSVHRTAALVFASGITVDAVSILDSFGFAASYAGVSYTLAGSFCSFLIESYGIEKFKQLYATGAYRMVYGRECADLASEWERFVRRMPLTSFDSMKAQYLFKRGSIFQKECVRVIANLNERTRHLMSGHEYEQALASAEYSLKLSRTPEAVLQKVNALFQLRKFQDVLAFVRLQECGMPHRGSSQSETSIRDILPVHLRAGDAYWALDSLEQAKREYGALLALHLSMGYDEACSVRLASIDSPERNALKIFFVYTSAIDDTERSARLLRLSAPPAKYLSAGGLMAKERYVEAEHILESAGRSSPLLEFFRLRLLGRALFLSMEKERARNIFQQAYEKSPSPAFCRETKEWLGRCIFDQK